jgi:hypothetical protein
VIFITYIKCNKIQERKRKIKEQDAYNTFVQCEIRYPKECSAPTTRKMIEAELLAFEKRRKERKENQKYYEYVRKFDSKCTHECYNNKYGYSTY